MEKIDTELKNLVKLFKPVLPWHSSFNCLCYYFFMFHIGPYRITSVGQRTFLRVNYTYYYKVMLLSLRGTGRKIRNCVGFLACRVQYLSKLLHNKQVNSMVSRFHSRHANLCYPGDDRSRRVCWRNNSEEIFLEDR